MNSPSRLSTDNHDRDAVQMRYVYPVVSRRAGGLSVGINLNPNNACNWHCAYCQVPDLTRGTAPPIDLQLLRDELTRMLDQIVHGPFMQQRVPEACRRLSDIAISGNGEPTSCAAFDQVVDLIIDVMREFDLSIPLRLISNGSYVHRAHVQRGLTRMAARRGEAWIKVDSATATGIARINGVNLDPARLYQQVVAAAGICPTWLQTCMVAWDGQPPSQDEVAAYLNFLTMLKQQQVPLRGVLLYGLARPSLQPEAAHLRALDEAWLQQMARRIRNTGFEVSVSI